MTITQAERRIPTRSRAENAKTKSSSGQWPQIGDENLSAFIPDCAHRASAARWPLRAADSIVEGQPVATNRPPENSSATATAPDAAHPHPEARQRWLALP
jgi:hypothetical protein